MRKLLKEQLLKEPVFLNVKNKKKKSILKTTLGTFCAIEKFHASEGSLWKKKKKEKKKVTLSSMKTESVMINKLLDQMKKHTLRSLGKTISQFWLF